MSRPQPTRPGAQRGPVRPAQTASKGPSAEEVNALPEFADDGREIDLDPAKAHDGGFASGEGTTVTINSARFGKFVYPGREDVPAQLHIFLEFAVPGNEFPRKENLKYADFAKFAATKDGNSVKLRASAVKKNRDGADYLPTLYKYDQGVMFLQSIKDAGVSADKINKEGLKSIVGLTVHVRRRKVAGQGENAKPALTVDYIDAKGTTAPAASTHAAPPSTQSVAPSVASEVDNLAEAALLDILGAAENNTIVRAQIPTTLIRLDKWKAHEQRGAILKTLRDDVFVNSADRKDVIWTVDGVNITKL